VGGDYYVVFRSDPGGGTGDLALGNNARVSAAPVSVQAVVPPDVVVQSLTVPANGTAGQPVTVDYALANEGPGAIAGATWFAAYYLSQDAVLDGSDVLLGSHPAPADLGVGASTAGSVELVLPSWASGAYYLIAAADSRNDLYEGSQEGDNRAARAILSALAPPADLEVVDATLPPGATPGLPVAIQYTLRNNGVNPATGVLQNAVYASADAAFASEQDPLIGIEQRTIDLAPGASTVVSLKVDLTRPMLADLQGNVIAPLPPLSPGAYRAVVRANIRNNIRESDYSDNLLVSGTTLQADVPVLPLDTPTPALLTDGQMRFFRIDTPAGQDLRVTVASDVPGATNEIYLAFGRTPDLTDYEFSGPPEFTASPSLLVPNTQAGSYYLMVAARDLGTLATSENLTLLARTLPFGIAGIAPAAGGQAPQVTTRLGGAGFREGTVLRLERLGVPAASGVVFRYINSTDLYVRWDLSQVPVGVYDVVAENAPETVLLPAGFTVEPARPAEVAVELVRPDVLRKTQTGTFEVRFRNVSNQDVGGLRARVLYPSLSVLRSLLTAPGLASNSEIDPGTLTPLVDDAFVAVDPASGDSIEAVDLVGIDLGAGEVRTATFGLSGFDVSPYPLRVVWETTDLPAFVDRETRLAEETRQALLAGGGSVPLDQSVLAADPAAWRRARLGQVLDAATPLAGGSPYEPASFPAPGFPLADAFGRGPSGPAPIEGCADPGPVPDCAPAVEVTQPPCLECEPQGVARTLPWGGSVALAATVCDGFGAGATFGTKVVTPCDPNLLTGPAGFGDERWVNAVQPMSYRVDFENLAEVATAPAQVVDIRIPLDPDLDLTTFRLGSLGFGTRTISVPPGRTTYSAEPFFADLNLRVRITAGVDIQRRELFWTFTSIDPETGQQPTNPYIGFLPVNDPTGSGTGFANFTVRPLANAPSGSQVQAQAAIQFDANAPLLTPEALNKVDTGVPSSAVTPTVDVLSAERVRVRWAGQDDASGAGLQSYSLYMKKDAGAFELVQAGLAVTELEVAVENGHSYSFYTLATDNTGNSEASKTSGEANVTVGTPQLGTDASIPLRTALYQNAPNPVRDMTTIRFDLARSVEATLEVYDIAGRRVATPLDGKRMPAGRHSVQLRDLPGAAGVYFYRFKAGDYEQTRRMVMLR
jgi:hypothetical protein